MLARVLSSALSAIAPSGATADVNGIEAIPVEVEVNCGWGGYDGGHNHVDFPYFKTLLFSPAEVSTSVKSEDPRSRWRQRINDLYNESWVRPSAHETPKEFKQAENGCYW
jgi:hypothetical protein